MGYEVAYELLELRAAELHQQVLGPGGVGGDKRQVDLGLRGGRELDLRALGAFFEALQRHLVLLEVYALLAVELGDQPVDDAHVEVVAAQEGVAVGGHDLDDAVADLEYRDVERPAAKVIDRDLLLFLLVHAVGERGRGGLVDDALSTFRPAIFPASFVACRWLSSK